MLMNMQQMLFIFFMPMLMITVGNTLYIHTILKFSYAQEYFNFNTTNSLINYENNSVITKNIKTMENEKFEKSKIKIISTGDWGCNEQSQSTVNKIISSKPDIVISLGDMSYEEKGDCFYELISPIKNKTKIVFGNHDIEFGENKSLKEEYLGNFNLTKSFYSFDLKKYTFYNNGIWYFAFKIIRSIYFCKK